MHWWSDHFHLGDVPTWLAAVGAGIAALFAFGQLRALRSQVQMQRAELADVAEAQRRQMDVLELEIRDRRETQARQILISSNGKEFAYGAEAASENERSFRKTCVVENASLGAISTVRVIFKTPEGEAVPENARPVRREDGIFVQTRATAVLPIDRMDPDTAIKFSGPVDPETVVTSTTCEVRFRDAAGRRWLVDATGQLHEES